MATPNSQATTSKGIGRFFRETRAEIKKVVWPTRRELINSTLVVFVTVLIISGIIGIVDGIFSRLFQFLMHAIG